jgi:hypothetical protein
LARYLTKVSARQIGTDVPKVRVVEEVVELKPELEIEPFGYVGVLVGSHIRLHKGRIAESV